jgi:hypothetical protein
MLSAPQTATRTGSKFVFSPKLAPFGCGVSNPVTSFETTVKIVENPGN